MIEERISFSQGSQETETGKITNSLDYKGNEDLKSEISKIIGTGQDAKNSIAYQVLKWSFVSLAVIFVGVSCYTAYNIYQKQSESYIDDLIRGAGIITPIITLILGYVFGRSSENINNP